MQTTSRMAEMRMMMMRMRVMMSHRGCAERDERTQDARRPGANHDARMSTKCPTKKNMKTTKRCAAHRLLCPCQPPHVRPRATKTSAQSRPTPATTASDPRHLNRRYPSLLPKCCLQMQMQWKPELDLHVRLRTMASATPREPRDTRQAGRRAPHSACSMTRTRFPVQTQRPQPVQVQLLPQQTGN